MSVYGVGLSIFFVCFSCEVYGYDLGVWIGVVSVSCCLFQVFFGIVDWWFYMGEF